MLQIVSVGADPCVCPHFDASHLAERHRVSALHFAIWLFTGQTHGSVMHFTSLLFTGQTHGSAPTLNGLRINKPQAELTAFYPSKGHISQPKTRPSAMQKVTYTMAFFTQNICHLSSLRIKPCHSASCAVKDSSFIFHPTFTCETSVKDASCIFHPITY